MKKYRVTKNVVKDQKIRDAISVASARSQLSSLLSKAQSKINGNWEKNGLLDLLIEAEQYCDKMIYREGLFYDSVDRWEDEVEENLTVERLRTPRGTFIIYKGNWKDFERESDRDDWGFWFDHFDEADRRYKIMHNARTQHAIAVPVR